MEELTPLEESIYDMFTAENVEMKELEKIIVSKKLAKDINEMIKYELEEEKTRVEKTIAGCKNGRLSKRK